MQISMENILIPKGDISAQADLIQAHMKLMRSQHPDNPVMLICEANMSCELTLEVVLLYAFLLSHILAGACLRGYRESFCAHVLAV